MIKFTLEKKFTLIEMLLVIAIFAILTSMLLPALNQAKKQSMSIVCQNNLKQVGLATFQYANDFDGYAPPMYNGTCPVAYRIWYQLLLQNNYIRFPSGKNLLTCPSWYPFYYRGTISTWGTFSKTYGINYAYTKANPKRIVGDFKYFGKKRSPSDIPLYMDTIFGKPNLAPSVFNAKQAYHFGEPAWWPHFRHSLKGNSCFVDGHVQSIGYHQAQNDYNVVSHLTWSFMKKSPR